jgi:hypothetical protein
MSLNTPPPAPKTLPTVNMHPMSPLVQNFLVPAAWFGAGFLLAKLLSRPTVIKGF